MDALAGGPAVDVLVNNAGTIRRAPAAEHTDADWDDVLEVNLSAQFVLTRALAGGMLERGRGKIVFVASLLSFQGGINVPGYAASKGGVAQLTKALANEWAPRGVNVNAIAPGYIDTDNTQALRDDPTRSRQILERIPAGALGPARGHRRRGGLPRLRRRRLRARRRPAGRRRLARAVNGLPERLARDRVIAVLSVPDAETAEAACRALARGGLGCAEITFRTAAAAEAIARVSQIDDFVVGAGTVLTAGKARRAHHAGAAFAVAPATDVAVIDACRDLGLPFVPGAATATEIGRALSLGCPVVKLFPASLLGGPPFVAAMSAVYPDLRFMPTGGIGPASLRSYLDMPSVLACGGSWLADGRLLAERRFDEIERLARETVELAR